MDPTRTENSTSSVPFYWPFKRLFYGWAIVGTAVVASFTQVPMYGPVLSIFMKPIGDDMGWSRGEMSIAFTAGSLFGGIASSLVGRQLDRYGARVSVVAAGMIVTGVMIGLALMQELWQFWILFGAGRTAAIAGINLGVSVAVANWFIRKRGRTISLMAVGIRAGQAVFPLFLTPIIVALSWRHAYITAAAIAFLCIVIPSWLFLRRRPEDLGLLPDGDQPDEASEHHSTAPGPSQGKGGPARAAADVSWTLGEARRTLTYWLLVAAMVMVVFAQTAVNLHAVASFDDRGIAEGFAGVFVFLFAGAAAASAIVWGSLMDRFPVRRVVLVATVLSAIAMLALIVADSIPMAVVFALLYGLGTGGWTVGQTLILATYFGRMHLGTIRGSVQVISQPVGASGPLMAGFIHDFTGNYAVSFQIFFVAFLCITAVLFFARPPKPR